MEYFSPEKKNKIRESSHLHKQVIQPSQPESAKLSQLTQSQANLNRAETQYKLSL